MIKKSSDQTCAIHETLINPDDSKQCHRGKRRRRRGLRRRHPPHPHPCGGTLRGTLRSPPKGPGDEAMQLQANSFELIWILSDKQDVLGLLLGLLVVGALVETI